MATDVFVSYARSDDEDNDGWIERTVAMLRKEIRTRLGHPLEVFLDVQSIESGERFTTSLSHALYEAKVFVPIVSPAYLTRRFCRIELLFAILNEFRLRRAGTIVPIRFVELDAAADRAPDPLRVVLDRRQCGLDLTRVRLQDPRTPSPELRAQVSALAGSIISIHGSQAGQELDDGDLRMLIAEARRMNLLDVVPEELRARFEPVVEPSPSRSVVVASARAAGDAPEVLPPGARPSSASAGGNGAADVVAAAVGAAAVAGAVGLGALAVRKVVGSARPVAPMRHADDLADVATFVDRATVLRSHNRPRPRQTFSVGPLEFQYFGAGSFRGPGASFSRVLGSRGALLGAVAGRLGHARPVWVFADETSDRAFEFNSHVWVVVPDADDPGTGRPSVAFRTTMRAANISEEVQRAFAAYAGGGTHVSEHCRRQLQLP